MTRRENQDRLLSDNPCVRFHNGQRGYVRCTITPRNWRSDYQVVEQVTQPGATCDHQGVVRRRGRQAGARQVMNVTGM